MQYRPFSATGFPVSALGFGAMRLPLRGSTSADIDERLAVRMLRTAIDAGVNSGIRPYGLHSFWGFYGARCASEGVFRGESVARDRLASAARRRRLVPSFRPARSIRSGMTSVPPVPISTAMKPEGAATGAVTQRPSQDPEPPPAEQQRPGVQQDRRSHEEPAVHISPPPDSRTLDSGFAKKRAHLTSLDS